MLNLIEKELKERENFSATENGAIGYKTTKSALVDINYKVSSLRNSDENEIIDLFDKAFEENKEYALKWLFFSRDILEGLGERRLFRICYERLSDLDIDLFHKNLNNIPKYGRWDDLVSLIGITTKIDNYIIEIINSQLQKDIANLKQDKPISLLAKWLPSENASSMETKSKAKKIRKLLEMTPRKYRLMLSELRAHSNIVETKMCDNRWEEIDYEKVPSLANLKYKNAFMKHDADRRIKYLDSVEKGSAKMNMKTATPVDIVARYIDEKDASLELAWKNLKDVMVQDTLVVADGSSSMFVPVSGNTSALDVANALSIYTSEHNNGVYKNHSFSFVPIPTTYTGM